MSSWKVKHIITLKTFGARDLTQFLSINTGDDFLTYQKGILKVPSRRMKSLK